MRYDSKENINENIDKLILKVCNYNDISRRELMSKVKAIESLTKDDMVKLKMLKE